MTTIEKVSEEYSKKGEALGQAMGVSSENRMPDAFGVYIYNDYHGYGCVEVIENCLKEVKKAVSKKNYGAAFQHLEGLTIWNIEDGLTWSGIDNGEQFSALVKLIGAALVFVTRNLDDLDELKDIPNFKFVLEKAKEVGESMNQIGDPVSNFPAALGALIQGEDYEEEDEKMDCYDFLALYKVYESTYCATGMGGDKFDLSKLKPDELKKLERSGGGDDEGLANNIMEALQKNMPGDVAPEELKQMIEGILAQGIGLDGGEDDEDEDEDEDEDDEEEEGEEEEEEEEEEEKDGGGPSKGQGPASKRRKT